MRVADKKTITTMEGMAITPEEIIATMCRVKPGDTFKVFDRRVYRDDMNGYGKVIKTKVRQKFRNMVLFENGLSASYAEVAMYYRQGKKGGAQMNNKACTNCTYEYTCNWEPAGDKGCCENWRSETREPEPARFSKQAVLDIISNTSGCDGNDEYARGWDAACGVIRDVVEKREEEIAPKCTICKVNQFDNPDQCIECADNGFKDFDSAI